MSPLPHLACLRLILQMKDLDCTMTVLPLRQGVIGSTARQASPTTTDITSFLLIWHCRALYNFSNANKIHTRQPSKRVPKYSLEPVLVIRFVFPWRIQYLKLPSPCLWPKNMERDWLFSPTMTKGLFKVVLKCPLLTKLNRKYQTGFSRVTVLAFT